MKKLAFAALLALAMAICSCGSGTNTPVPKTGAGGIWEAQLYGGTGQAALLDFTSQFSVGDAVGAQALDITSFKFINSNSCFPVSISTSDANSGESGSATLTTSASNQVTGSLTYNVAAGSDTLLLTTTASSGLPGGQVTGMSVNSALQNGVVTGNWTVSGSCSGSGTFVMCQEAVPNGAGGCGTAN